MLDCKKLIHPFQNDPGTSQHQRVIDGLLEGSASIDGRTLCDLLHYLLKLSGNINFYDRNLNSSDWRLFFSNSLPFLLADLAHYDHSKTESKARLYNSLFTRRPSITGLELMLVYLFQNGFKKINTWYRKLVASELPLERDIDSLIRNSLSQPLKQFIALNNAAAKWYCVRRIDVSSFMEGEAAEAWQIDLPDLYAISEQWREEGMSKCARLAALYKEIFSIYPTLLEAIKLIASHAESNIRQSLLPLAKDLQKNHAPHHALIFAFLKMFTQLQGELNKKTKEHLRFFYEDVLRLKPRPAVPDQAHIIFELQKIIQGRLQKYELAKGRKLLGGKDEKNADLIFGLNEAIVVNEVKLSGVRSLFLNHENRFGNRYVEGVYIAPAANKADGIKKDFGTDSPKGWYTLGSKFSKYKAEGKNVPNLHPHARIGFILASPVLYLAEGERTVSIQLKCKLDTGCQLDGLVKPQDLFNKIRKLVNRTFVLINDSKLQEAIDQGLAENWATLIRNLLPGTTNEFCAGNESIEAPSIVLPWGKWKHEVLDLADANTKTLLSGIFYQRKLFTLSFSGEKEWIWPQRARFVMSHMVAPPFFTLRMIAKLPPELPAVTFFDKVKLKEDFNTTLPLVKIEMDDNIKLKRGFTPAKLTCCQKSYGVNKKHSISCYHFFREVRVLPDSTIDVKVCGLRNFLVQNDESVLDVNGVILPYGARPRIGSNFFLGCAEVFCKNWSLLTLKFNWKDKPVNFSDYYHGYEDKTATPQIVTNDFKENRFLFQYSFLEHGGWVPHPIPVLPPPAPNTSTTDIPGPAPASFHKLFVSDTVTVCSVTGFEQAYSFNRTDFPLSAYQPVTTDCFLQKPFRNDAQNGFLRFTLVNQDFQHARYSFVLTRQMLALGKFPDVYVGPVYDGIDPTGNATEPVMTFDEMFDSLKRAYQLSTNSRNRLNTVLPGIVTAHGNSDQLPNANPAHSTFYDAALWNPHTGAKPVFPPAPFILPEPVIPAAPELDQFSLHDIVSFMEDSVLKPIYDKIEKVKQVRVVIPKEPYTPQIKGMALDYKASAAISQIDLIHLYPFAGTYKQEDLAASPWLMAHFCEEGNLFMGFDQMEPGILNLLFQLAEATADAEVKQEVSWEFLESNNWRPLRRGFEVLNDATNELTTSGIVKLQIPDTITNKNTVLPAGQHWIHLSSPINSRSVSELIDIHPQAVLASFENGITNDQGRLSKPLEAGTLAKLLVADAAIKQVSQPYASFGGRVPEEESSYYLRVSERLRHKGRAIQKWDYERLVLEKFPEVFKAKCINHSFQTDSKLYVNDIPMAPGYVLLALIPDLNKLLAGNSLAPKAPVSLLEKVDDYFKNIISPFVRFKAVNPRYEKVCFWITVKLYPGFDEKFYSEKLRQDLSGFIAPWSIGTYDKLSFGQCLNQSDIIRFLEGRNYVDYILRLEMKHEALADKRTNVCPLSPRSILIAGDIEVKTETERCDAWCSDPVERKDCNIPVLVNDYCSERIN